MRAEFMNIYNARDSDDYINKVFKILEDNQQKYDEEKLNI